MSLLSVTVKKARFIGAQAAVQWNSYVTLKLQNVKSTTVTVKGGNPSWEQDFLFEINNLDTGLLIEVWNKGLIWDKAVGYHLLHLREIHHSNVVSFDDEGAGRWISLEAELVMEDGEVVGTKTPTGHMLLLDARFELPLAEMEGDEDGLQRKLEMLNSMLDQEARAEQARRQHQYYVQSGVSEDSDYTSDVNYPVGQHPNSSASQFLSAAHSLTTPQRSLNSSRENSYEKDDDYRNTSQYLPPPTTYHRPRQLPQTHGLSSKTQQQQQAKQSQLHSSPHHPASRKMLAHPSQSQQQYWDDPRDSETEPLYYNSRPQNYKPHSAHRRHDSWNDGYNYRKEDSFSRQYEDYEEDAQYSPHNYSKRLKNSSRGTQSLERQDTLYHDDGPGDYHQNVLDSNSRLYDRYSSTSYSQDQYSQKDSVYDQYSQDYGDYEQETPVYGADGELVQAVPSTTYDADTGYSYDNQEWGTEGDTRDHYNKPKTYKELPQIPQKLPTTTSTITTATSLASAVTAHPHLDSTTPGKVLDFGKSLISSILHPHPHSHPPTTTTTATATTTAATTPYYDDQSLYNTPSAISISNKQHQQYPSVDTVAVVPNINPSTTITTTTAHHQQYEDPDSTMAYENQTGYENTWDYNGYYDEAGNYVAYDQNSYYDESGNLVTCDPQQYGYYDDPSTSIAASNILASTATTLTTTTTTSTSILGGITTGITTNILGSGAEVGILSSKAVADYPYNNKVQQQQQHHHLEDSHHQHSQEQYDNMGYYYDQDGYEYYGYPPEGQDVIGDIYDRDYTDDSRGGGVGVHGDLKSSGLSAISSSHQSTNNNYNTSTSATTTTTTINANNISSNYNNKTQLHKLTSQSSTEYNYAYQSAENLSSSYDAHPHHHQFPTTTTSTTCTITTTANTTTSSGFTSAGSKMANLTNITGVISSTLSNLISSTTSSVERANSISRRASFRRQTSTRDYGLETGVGGAVSGPNNISQSFDVPHPPDHHHIEPLINATTIKPGEITQTFKNGIKVTVQESIDMGMGYSVSMEDDQYVPAQDGYGEWDDTYQDQYPDEHSLPPRQNSEYDPQYDDTLHEGYNGNSTGPVHMDSLESNTSEPGIRDPDANDKFEAQYWQKQKERIAKQASLTAQDSYDIGYDAYGGVGVGIVPNNNNIITGQKGAFFEPVDMMSPPTTMIKDGDAVLSRRQSQEEWLNGGSKKNSLELEREEWMSGLDRKGSQRSMKQHGIGIGMDMISRQDSLVLERHPEEEEEDYLRDDDEELDDEMGPLASERDRSGRYTRKTSAESAGSVSPATKLAMLNEIQDDTMISILDEAGERKSSLEIPGKDKNKSVSFEEEPPKIVHIVPERHTKGMTAREKWLWAMNRICSQLAVSTFFIIFGLFTNSAD